MTTTAWLFFGLWAAFKIWAWFITYQWWQERKAKYIAREERDAALKAGLESATEFDREVYALAERADRLEVQLAGCGAAALGSVRDDQVATKDDYGWSASYQDVVKLRRDYEDTKSSLHAVMNGLVGFAEARSPTEAVSLVKRFARKGGADERHLIESGTILWEIKELRDRMDAQADEAAEALSAAQEAGKQLEQLRGSMRTLKQQLRDKPKAKPASKEVRELRSETNEAERALAEAQDEFHRQIAVAEGNIQRIKEELAAETEKKNKAQEEAAELRSKMASSWDRVRALTEELKAAKGDTA